MKFKKLSILLTLMLAMSTFFSTFAFAENIDKPNLVALGDSITAGTGLANPATEAFPALIKKGEFDVANRGIPGLPSTKLLTDLKSNNQLINEVRAASVVTLNIGGNDLLQAAGITKEAIENDTLNVDQAKVQAAIVQISTNVPTIIGEIKK